MKYSITFKLIAPQGVAVLLPLVTPQQSRIETIERCQRLAA